MPYSQSIITKFFILIYLRYTIKKSVPFVHFVLRDFVCTTCGPRSVVSRSINSMYVKWPNRACGLRSFDSFTQTMCECDSTTLAASNIEIEILSKFLNVNKIMTTTRNISTELALEYKFLPSVASILLGAYAV
mgnify:CR=1 FL=1